MAREQSSTPSPETLLAVGRHLLEAGGIDCVYRDVYLRRAFELVEPLLSSEEYHAVKQRQKDCEKLLRQNRQALQEQDWARVKALSARIESLRSSIEARRAEVEFGDALSRSACTVPLDPFSPGYETVLIREGLSATDIRDDVVGTLKALEQRDAALARFYGGRRDYFSRLEIAATAATKAEAVRDPAQIEREALWAMESGAVDRLQELADEMLRIRSAGSQGPSGGDGAATVQARHRCPVDIGAPFPGDAVLRARALGLAAHTLPAARADVGPIVDFMYQNAYSPTFSDEEAQTEGSVRLHEVIQERKLPAALAGALQEFVELFMRHPYVNSGGARYLPPICKEAVLFEDFPEDADPPATSELLAALHLPRRRGLSRLEIEDALLRYGPDVLQERLGLDPLEFRVVCIPLDLYARLGPERNWGEQQQWTHFDGYQVMRALKLRALVGGDVRYGGLVDLVSISPDACTGPSPPRKRGSSAVCSDWIPASAGMTLSFRRGRISSLPARQRGNRKTDERRWGHA